MTNKRISSLSVSLLLITLSACVTQEFENNETPVVKNQANKDDMAATRISLGLGYLKMGNMPQAKQNLEKAKNFSPEMVQVYTAFAHYYETVGENELAIASFEEALSLDSNDADTLNNYGVFLCRQGKTEAAEKQLLQAIAVPTYVLVAKSYENLSSCFLEKDNFVKAEMYLHKALMHSPGNSSILFQMARLQYAMGEFAQAKTYIQRFEKVTRRFTPQALALAYKVYLKLKERRTAKNYGTMIVKMYPQSWEAQQYLLNELELIEVDNLAKRYQLTQLSDLTAKPKKRVVKLSPKRLPSEKSLLNNQPLNNEKTTKIENSVYLIQEKIATQQTPKSPTVSKQNTKKIPYVAVNNKPSEIHVVEKGDSLYSISMKYNIKIKALRRWNNLFGKRKIYIDDRIFLIDPKTVNK